MEFKQYVVAGITEESPDVRTFRLARKDGPIPPYQPGHFFLLRLPDGTGKSTHRPYSVASHPSQPELWFCVKNKGFFPTLLWKLKEGDGIEVDGPYGIFLLRQDDSERVFIGGGVGISALRSMILQTANEGKRSWLFHSAHALGGLAYFEEMEKLASQKPNFSFLPSITGDDLPDGWDGLRGRISVQMLKEKLGTLEGKAFYLCGSKEMAGTLAAALLAEGVPKDKVRKDEWG